jgi:glycosyltransferase involved in cell wall biosynthesis
MSVISSLSAGNACNISKQPVNRFRLAVLWAGLSGYLAAGLRELQRQGTELFVAHSEFATNAPFSREEFGFIDRRIEWRGSPNPASLSTALRQFNPQGILVAGWHIRGYRPILRKYGGKIPRIMCMDNQWRGTTKQWLGILTARVFVHPLCDQVWVPGERQASFAARLGFPGSEVMRGMYCCDFDAFSQEAERRLGSSARLPRAFLFTGRLVPEKGLDVLVLSYRRYRQLSSDPWPLLVCGEGPWRARLANEPGIRLIGFVQPSKLPQTFAGAACLVLPSKFEPWGVVVHEAAAAGLAIIASTEVGSTAHLLQDGYNGFLFSPGDVERLSRLLLQYSTCSEQIRHNMAVNSFSLARQFTPARWASYLLGRMGAFSIDGATAPPLSL